ncbi:MAG: STAS domain-containing protein [Anaerolineae bacterium]|nr:STAS domain-containing protein [Anaerolineae bacterium]
MEYKVRNESGIAILDLSGEIDVSTATQLRDTLIDLIENNEGRLLVNMSDVAYIDSSGLSVLVAAHKKAQGANGMLGLSGPQKPVQQVFELTRMNKLFNIFPTVEEGIAAVSQA